jgi:hypothetical protein
MTISKKKYIFLPFYAVKEKKRKRKYIKWLKFTILETILHKKLKTNSNSKKRKRKEQKKKNVYRPGGDVFAPGKNGFSDGFPEGVRPLQGDSAPPSPLMHA